MPTLLKRLVTALRTCGAPEEAIASADEGLERFPGFTDLVFAQGLAALALGKEDDAIGYWRALHRDGRRPRAVYGAAVGAGTYLPRIALAELYARRGELESARELLDRCLARASRTSSASSLPYATVLLRSGVAPDGVVARDRGPASRADHRRPGSCSRRALGHGAMAAAETQFRAVLDSRPSSSQVRVRLAETLLNQRRYAEAARQAADVADEDPFAAWPAGSSCGAGSPPAISTGARRRRAAPRGPASRRPSSRCSRPGSRLAGGRRGASPPAGRGHAAARRDPRDAPARPRVRGVREAACCSSARPFAPASGASCWPRCTSRRATSPRRRRSGWPSASAAPTPARSWVWRASRGPRRARGRRRVRRRGPRATIRPAQRRARSSTAVDGEHAEPAVMHN